MIPQAIRSGHSGGPSETWINVAKHKRLKQLGELKGAPDWYGTPLDELHFEWSPEEKLEIERYSEKILKNVEQEGGMTPLERFRATVEGRPRDRVLIAILHGNGFGVRVLDSSADALKPIDLYRNPKLWVKMQLANAARFGLDYPHNYTISYGEELWGGHARMIEYGHPVAMGDPPIRSVEDLEGMEVPDPRKDGLFPGYLWANRELRRIYDEYGLSQVMPLFPYICACPVGTAMLWMLGWAAFLRAMRRNPELCRRCLELATAWEIRYGQAVIDLARPDALYVCSMVGATDTTGNEWLADYWARVGQALGSQVPIIYGYGFGLAAKWIPVLWERGALGPGSFCGGYHDHEQSDIKTMLDLHRERDLVIASIGSARILLEGPVSAIEEEIRHLVELGKPYVRFSIAIGMCDYWTPPSHLDAAIAAARKYGRY